MSRRGYIGRCRNWFDDGAQLVTGSLACRRRQPGQPSKRYGFDCLSLIYHSQSSAVPRPTPLGYPSSMSKHPFPSLLQIPRNAPLSSSFPVAVASLSIPCRPVPSVAEFFSSLGAHHILNNSHKSRTSVVACVQISAKFLG